jgi:hypothetical protein
LMAEEEACERAALALPVLGHCSVRLRAHTAPRPLRLEARAWRLRKNCGPLSRLSLSLRINLRGLHRAAQARIEAAGQPRHRRMPRG